MYKNLTRFTASDLPAARRSLARVISISIFLGQSLVLGQINGAFSNDKDRQGIKKLSDGPEWLVTVVRCKTFLWYLIRHLERGRAR